MEDNHIKPLNAYFGKQWRPGWNAASCGISSVSALFIRQNRYSGYVWFDSLSPINNISVIKGRVFLGWTSTKLGLIFLFKYTTQWRQWGSNPAPRSRVKHSTTEPLHYLREWKTFVDQKLLNGYYGKQWRPRWNAASCGISSGSALFTKTKSIFRERNTLLFKL